MARPKMKRKIFIFFFFTLIIVIGVFDLITFFNMYQHHDVNFLSETNQIKKIDKQETLIGESHGLSYSLSSTSGLETTEPKKSAEPEQSLFVDVEMITLTGEFQSAQSTPELQVFLSTTQEEIAREIEMPVEIKKKWFSQKEDSSGKTICTYKFSGDVDVPPGDYYLRFLAIDEEWSSQDSVLITPKYPALNKHQTLYLYSNQNETFLFPVADDLFKYGEPDKVSITPISEAEIYYSDYLINVQSTWPLWLVKDIVFKVTSITNNQEFEEYFSVIFINQNNLLILIGVLFIGLLLIEIPFNYFFKELKYYINYNFQSVLSRPAEKPRPVKKTKSIEKSKSWGIENSTFPQPQIFVSIEALHARNKERFIGARQAFDSKGQRKMVSENLKSIKCLCDNKTILIDDLLPHMDIYLIKENSEIYLWSNKKLREFKKQNINQEINPIKKYKGFLYSVGFEKYCFKGNGNCFEVRFINPNSFRKGMC